MITAQEKKDILSSCNRIPPQQLVQLVLIGDLTIEELIQAGLAEVRLRRVCTEVEAKQVQKDWESVRSSNNPDQLKHFISVYGGSGRYETLIEQAERLLKEFEIAQMRRDWDEVRGLNDLGRLRKFIDLYKARFPESVIEAERMLVAHEEQDYASLNESLEALKRFILLYPTSKHLREVENRAWSLVDQDDKMALTDFLQNFPNSLYVSYAESALEKIRKEEEEEQAWQALDKQNPEAIARFLSCYPEGNNAWAAKEELERLRRMKVEQFRHRIDVKAKYEIKNLIDTRVCEERDFVDTGIVTQTVMERIMERDKRSIQIVQADDPNLDSPKGNTDIFFFGIPTSGKTCVLAGLVNRKAKDFSFRTSSLGGRYAEQLQTSIDLGIAPAGTRTNYLSLIDSTINDAKGEQHPVSLVEMSGEKVVFKISNNDLESIGFEDMGDGAGRLLANKNRKNIYFVIDSSVDGVTEIRSTENPNEIVTASQPQIISRIIDLLLEPRNRSILKLVDTIHFVMTKSDLLDCEPEERKNKATEIVETKYGTELNKLKTLCKDYGINRNYEYTPRVYPFSLGRFMPGNYLEYDRTDSDLLMNVIKASTMSVRKRNVWDNVRDFVNKGIG